MKKFLSISIFAALLACVLSAKIFALDAGAGGLLGYTFTRYTLESPGFLNHLIPGDIKSLQTMDRFDYGGFLFLDAVYGELTLMLQGGKNTYGEDMSFRPQGQSWGSLSDETGSGTEMTLGFSLLGKYPFAINDKISWFPLLGAEYQIALLEWRKPEGDTVHDRTTGELAADQNKDGNPYPLSAWNSLWIKLGAGVDYTISGPLFIRGEILYGFRLMTPYETGALAMTKNTFDADNPKLKGLTSGPTVKIGIGYRF
jgi:opacity protein-like surface antigen